MAFLAQANPNDDQTEQTGQVNPTISTGSQDVTLAPAPLNATSVAPPPDATTPNQTKGSGFTNIQRYLNANQTGAANLGTQVAGSINDQTNQATAATKAVGDYAASNPTADIYNSQPDVNAQQAITNANQKAALTANIGGQSQLIRDIAPTTSNGGVNLDQFLMQQGTNYNKVSDAAKQAAGLQGQYGVQSTALQNNATTAQALQALQKQAAAAAAGKAAGSVTVTTPSTPQVPNTSDIGANTDTGATTGNPYLGLSADQIAYLQSLQNSYGKTTGSTTGTGGVGTAAPVATTGLLNRGTISKTATVNTTGSHGPSVDVTGSDTGGFTDQSDKRYSIDANGNVTANDTGISNGTAGVIGKVISGLTGIPGLALLGSYLNNKYNADAQAAADKVAADRANAVLGGTGEAISVGGDPVGAGDAEAAANAGNVPQTQPTPTTPEQAAAAAAEGGNLTPGEVANERAAQEQAAANQAAYAAAVQQAQEQAAQQAANEAAAQQAANEQAAAQQAANEAAQSAADSSNSDSSSSSDSSSGSDSSSSSSSGGEGGGGSSSGSKDGGFITGPGTSRSDSIPRMLSNGEYVVKASVVKALGKEFFDRLNNSVK